MTDYIDPTKPDEDVAKRSQIERDKARATDFDREVLFSGESFYCGTEDQLRRLRARRGTNNPRR